MFGYATDETPECMPLTLQLAHQMNKKIADLRRDGTLWWARPDSKTQVIIKLLSKLLREFISIKLCCEAIHYCNSIVVLYKFPFSAYLGSYLVSF